MTAEILKIIDEQIGLKLTLCDHFTGIRKKNGKKYFNIILNENTCESKEYDKLKSFSDKYKLFSIEPNGQKRVSIILNK